MSECSYCESSSESSQWAPPRPKRESAWIDQTKRNKYVRAQTNRQNWIKKTGTTNTKGISWCSHSGVMLLHPGLYHFQQISGRCFLQLLGQCLRLPIKEHVSFRLVGAIKVCVGGVLLLYYTEVCWKHSTHECFWRSFISSQMCFFFNWKSYIFKGYTFNLSPSKHAGTSWNWKSIYILTIKWN